MSNATHNRDRTSSLVEEQHVSLEEDFLAAIRAAPDDDGPRLVYADWLDEHGDPRGEFIRVQLALAGLEEDDPARERLEGRERQLLVDNEAHWIEPLRDCGVVRWRFRRGLAEEVHLPFDALLRQGS